MKKTTLNTTVPRKSKANAKSKSRSRSKTPKENVKPKKKSTTKSPTHGKTSGKKYHLVRLYIHALQHPNDKTLVSKLENSKEQLHKELKQMISDSKSSKEARDLAIKAQRTFTKAMSTLNRVVQTTKETTSEP
jgi:NCAIR mutase (PurE)-related protein